MRRLLAVACALLAAGCGLPLGSGVHEPGPVPAEERHGGDVQVLPPGPRDDAPPVEIVRDFYGAQSSPANAHASAREFLAPEARARWRDNAPLGVLAGRLSIAPVAGQPTTFRVTGSIVAEIAADGSYNPGRKPVDLQVRVRQGPSGRWLITDVPAGLLLSAADRERSYRAHNIYFLAPPPAPGAAASHLVPDQVFLPVTADSADGLVQRLLAGPSRQLGDSVSTAFPAGTALRRPVVTSSSGEVTVDLTEQAGRAPALLREQMSAQLVWTLRGDPDFSELRLLGAGRPFPRGPDGKPIVRADFLPYDPDGLVPRAPLYYIGGRRLRLLDPSAGPEGPSSLQVVDAAAASPRGGTLALLTQVGSGYEMRTGPPNGPFVLRVPAAKLSSPSWGSGEQGIWFLRGGRVTLAPVGARPIDVPVDGLNGLGPISRVRISRDGVRAGIIAGVGRGRRLLVGRVAMRNGALRIVRVRNIAPGVTDVSDLSWENATSLVVLGRAVGVTAPVRVAVDGSSVALVNRIGLEGKTPVTIAAAPKLPLVVGAVLGDGVQVLCRETGLLLVREPGVGAQPFYPG